MDALRVRAFDHAHRTRCACYGVCRVRCDMMLTLTDWLLSDPAAIVAFSQQKPDQLVTAVAPVQSC